MLSPYNEEGFNVNGITTYSTEKHSAEELVADMVSFFSERNMKVRRTDSPDGIITVLQARISSGRVKQFIGMDRTAVIRITRSGTHMNAESGGARWTDKAAVMTLSMFVLFPLAVTSGIGVYKQYRLMKAISQEIHDFMTGTQTASKPGLISRGIESARETLSKPGVQAAITKLIPLVSRELVRVMNR